MADELDDPGLTEKRKAASRTAQQRLESRLVGGHRGSRVIPGHAIDPARDRVRLIAAQDHALSL